MSYFIEYCLGRKGESNLAASKGSCTHKILEILAKIKLAQQNNILYIEDDIYGHILTNDFNIDDIIKKVYVYYSTNATHLTWAQKDFEDCKQWTYMVLDLNDGAFNPLKSNIVSPETPFNIVINEPWAKYHYNYSGQILEGQLALKGTMDLITEPSPDILELVDYKTSASRKNWATGKIKTDADLRQDIQLLIYYLAISHLYPKAKQVIVTIYYIRAGGPVSMCFDNSDIPKALDMLREKFEYIKNTKIPKLSRDYKCKTFCRQGTTTFDGTNIEPLVEFRNGMLSKKGEFMKKCDQCNYYINKYGIDRTIKDYTLENFSTDFYQKPG